MFCQKCGKEMSDSAQFCTNCGWSKNGVNPSAVGGKKFNLPIIPIVAVVAVLVVEFFASKIFMGGGSIAKDAKLVTSYSTDTTIDQMETVKFGSDYQNDAFTKEPIEWIVLDKQGGRTLLLSKYILDCKCYNNKYKDVTWETCDLRKWLNNDFYYQAFNSSEQEKIQTTNVINNNNIDCGTYGGNNTNDKVFCLSIEETRKYFGNGTKEDFGYQLGKNVATKGTNYAKTVDNGGNKLWVSDSSDKWYYGNSVFWLRSPGYGQDYAAFAYSDGYLDTTGCYVYYPYYGVRPALWISE